MPEDLDPAFEAEGYEIALCLDVFAGVLFDMALVHRDGIALYVALQSFAKVLGDDIKRMSEEGVWANIEGVVAKTTEIARDRLPRIYMRVDG